MDRDQPPVGTHTDPGPAGHAEPAQLLDLLLTRDREQRRWLRGTVISSVVYLVCIGILAYGTHQGMFDPGPVRILMFAMAATTPLFYLLIRSGATRGLADPAMTFAQGLVAQTLIAIAYALTGPIHAATLMLFALVLTFGMYDMRVRHARVMAGYSIAVAACAMLWGWQRDPLDYPATQEGVYFVLALTVLVAISQLSVVLSGMRTRLTHQKRELQQALAQIQELATHDELTGLSNRRHILELLEQHALRHQRGGPAFHVVMADLDHFKRINDTYGHAVGDDALRTFARQAKAQLRNIDIVGRWGGEEFLLLMPETATGDPKVGLERLRAALAETEASAQVSGLRVQFSAGLSSYRQHEAVGDTIERADRAAYAAKAGGRNRTVAL